MNWNHPWIVTSTGVLVLVSVAALAHIITRYLLLRLLHRLAKLLPGDTGTIVIRNRVLGRLAAAIPIIIVMFGITLVSGLPEGVPRVVSVMAQVALFIVLVGAFSAALNVVNELYERNPSSQGKPIKGYLQMVRIVMFIVAGLLILGTLLDRDIFTLLAGLGAMAAVLMLVFQTTLLSLVASVQVSSYDMVRVGDWIEMPALNADGDVVDISLHTIKVQNWDKTITVIPTNRLLSDTFKNWRGIEEAGGRRIRRAMFIDQNSIRFLSDEERARLKRLHLLDDYLERKKQELEEWNEKLAEHGKEPGNTRRITNIGTFRAYAYQYLVNHPDLNHDLTTMVRQLDPTPQGLPIQLYAFTKSTKWTVHEGIQSDIFDHMFAILPEFGLRVFQQPSGLDWRDGFSGPVSVEP
jgi:miniconductance mechanosensitive channel